MSPHHWRHSRYARSERGVALIAALMGVAILTVLGVAITGLGIMAATVSRNERESHEALAIADAGISHAKRLILWQEWASFNQFLQNAGGVGCDGDELSQAPVAPLPPGYPIAAAEFIPAAGRVFGRGQYRVAVCDDHSTDVDPTTGLLDMNPNADVNRRLFLRSTGVGPDGASATVELVIDSQDMPAVITNSNLRVTGQPRAMGAGGAFHSNLQTDLQGNACAQQFFSSTGTTSVSGGSAGGGAACTPGELDVRPDSPPINIPSLLPIDYKSQADYWLRSDGRIYDMATMVVLCASPPCGGGVQLNWTWDGGLKRWTNGQNIRQGTYYADANIVLASSFGSSLFRLSLITEGFISVSGSPTTRPDLVLPNGRELAMLAGTDIRLAGTSAILFQGIYYARHQLDIGGTPQINGQVLAFNAADTAYPNPSQGANNLVPLVGGYMVISGSPTITFTGNGLQSARGRWWRECRGVDALNPCGDP
jgi:PilX N-terminal